MSIRTVTYEICGKRHSKPFSLIICFVFCETYHSGNESEYQAFVAFVLQSQGGQWRLEDGGGGRVGLPLVLASSSSHTYTLWSNQQVLIPHLLQAPQKIPMLYYTYHILHIPKHETAAQTCEMAMKGKHLLNHNFVHSKHKNKWTSHRSNKYQLIIIYLSFRNLIHV